MTHYMTKLWPSPLHRRLSERVDVLVENFRPGVMEKWGLGPQDLKPELGGCGSYAFIGGSTVGAEDMQGSHCMLGLTATAPPLGSHPHVLHTPAPAVYTRISGFGQTGPKAREPGYASVCEAFGGFR